MRKSSGWTLLETLVVLALALLVAAPLVARPGAANARRAAAAVQTFLAGARIEAIRRDQPVAVTYRADRRTFELRVGADGSAFGTPCAGAPLRSLALDRFPRIDVLRGLRDDLVWLPTGMGRTCAGSGVIAGSIVLGSGRPEQRLVISSAGRIRRESLP